MNLISSRLKAVLLLICLVGSQIVTSATQIEEFAFQADVHKVMDIIINSLYKDSDIFLRELISNGSDALDKLRFIGLTNTTAIPADWNYNITIKVDKDKRLLIIQDTGIGMTKEHLNKNLGTIAKSGTKEFLEAIGNKKINAQQIGQFGVGFYSAYLVADQVQVITKHIDDGLHVWSYNKNDGKYYIRPAIDEDNHENPVNIQGTKIILKIKEDKESDSILSEEYLMDLIKKHSQFINFPIYMWTNTSKTEEVPLTEEENLSDTLSKTSANDTSENPELNKQESEKQPSDDQPKVEDAREEEKEKTKSKTKTVTVYEGKYVLVNDVKPIWTRSPKDISETEYNSFYRSFGKDSQDPLLTVHFSGDTGTTDFKCLFFVPSKPSFNPFSKDEPSRFISIFIKGVLITDEFKDFPRFLSFIKAIVDADDIPINVSREMLQKHKVMKIIGKKIVTKALSTLEELGKNDPEKYNKFYSKYASHIKLGIMTEESYKDEMIPLLRFRSSLSPKNWTSFDEYIERMANKKNQTEIYYVTGSSVAEMQTLPYVERILKRGYEVLFLEDLFDDQMIQSVFKYKNFSLRNLAKAGATLGDETESDKKSREADAERYKPLIDYLKKKFSFTIETVSISSLLDDSPMAIVAGALGYSPQMERAAKGYKDDFMASFMLRQKKVMEINPNHPLMESLLKKVQTDSSPSIEFDEDVQLLYDAALLHSGYELKNPSLFAHRVEDMIRAKYGLDRLPEDIKKAKTGEDEVQDPMDFLKGAAGADFPGFGSSGMMDDMSSFPEGDMNDAHDEDHSHDDKHESHPVHDQQDSKSDNQDTLKEKDEL